MRFNVVYRVCPRCGNPMKIVNGSWVCIVCGHAARTEVTASRR